MGIGLTCRVCWEVSLDCQAYPETLYRASEEYSQYPPPPNTINIRIIKNIGIYALADRYNQTNQ